MIESLTDYVLVSQDAHRIEHRSRQPDVSWRIAIAQGLNASMSLGAIGCELQLREAYDKVGL